MQINEVIFAGNLGKDAELFVSQSGMSIVTLNVCHSYKKAYKEGEPITTWVTVKVFGNWAETAKNFKKGMNVIVKGTLSENKWKDKESGKDRSSLQINANQIGGIVQNEFKTNKTDPDEKLSPPGFDFKAPVFEDIPF